jgi:hypothetical protein
LTGILPVDPSKDLIRAIDRWTDGWRCEQRPAAVRGDGERRHIVANLIGAA